MAAFEAPSSTMGITKLLSALNVVKEGVKLGVQVVLTVVFLLFMLEEAAQAAGFGVFTLMQGKMWKDAKRQNGFYRYQATVLKEWCDTLDKWSPDVFNVLIEPFRQFANASLNSADANDRRIRKEQLAELTN